MADFAASLKGPRLSSLDAALVQEIFLYLPVFEIKIYDNFSCITGAIAFGASSKRFNLVLNICYPRFCSRDFAAYFDRSGFFILPNLGIKVNQKDSVFAIATSPMKRLSLSSNGKDVWQGFHSLWRSCVYFGNHSADIQEKEDDVVREESSKAFQRLAAAWEKIFCFDVMNIPEMISLTMEDVIQVSDNIRQHPDDCQYFVEVVSNVSLRTALVTS